MSLLYLCERIQGNSPAMLTAILDSERSDVNVFSFNNEFIRNLIFGILEYMTNVAIQTVFSN